MAGAGKRDWTLRVITQPNSSILMLFSSSLIQHVVNSLGMKSPRKVECFLPCMLLLFCSNSHMKAS